MLFRSTVDIAEVPGIGEKIALIISETLHAQDEMPPSFDLGTGEIRG